ncbi:MAG: hypothetical protein ACYDDZ_06660 [Acidimicrobiales bacterium]
MRRGGTPVWAFAAGALFVLVGAWALLNGLACAALTSSLPPSPGPGSSVSQFCGTYEWGGAFLVALGILIPLVAILASHHGRGASGRAIRSSSRSR